MTTEIKSLYKKHELRIHPMTNFEAYCFDCEEEVLWRYRGLTRTSQEQWKRYIIVKIIIHHYLIWRQHYKMNKQFIETCKICNQEKWIVTNDGTQLCDECWQKKTDDLIKNYKYDNSHESSSLEANTDEVQVVGADGSNPSHDIPIQHKIGEFIK